MGRSPCCAKEGLNKGAWTSQEDDILIEYIRIHGEGKWRNLPKNAGLKRCGKSCRLRWLNYLRPDIKRGNISPDEEELIVRLHKLLGNRWSLIAGRLPGRTDNEIKNYWNTNLGKKVQNQQISTTVSIPPKLSGHSDENNFPPPTVSTPPMLSAGYTDENNFNPPTINLMSSIDTSTLPSSPISKTCTNSHVIRTKAFRCSSKLIQTPQPNKCKENLETNVIGVGLVPMDGHEHHSINKPKELSGTFDELLSLVTSTTTGSGDHNNNQSSDLGMNFNVGDICLSDLLNSDFSNVCDFNYSDDNSNDLSPVSADQPPLMQYSDDHRDMLQDWKTSNCVQTMNYVAPNRQYSFSSLLNSGGEWFEE
ncbi:myb-related protein 330-like [Carya illinoinensis]|uniref:Myb-related protein 123 n=1 Tax=Carya illinoinensis TaxID=32201 RepID=A0A8T1R702_CARIL|nr:myb-related protein 330-like [Carya illinoinensis]KAG6661921.1 hypothetical protein CIPAW_03G208600 [Carya illinoinensis]KAG6723205.1 hypothetical protein I3842_03G197700 [Carya illinoinensis]